MQESQESDYVIRAENLHYKYEDGSIALKGVDLCIKRGQKLALLGANGSGKSTFFLCLNGVLRPDKGKLYYGEKEYSYKKKDLLSLRGKVGIVFQDPDRQLFLTDVFQEIAFGPLNLMLPEEIVTKRVEEVLKELSMTEYRDKPVHALSGGQKKQVAVADVLVMQPEVIILDEPAAALDPLHAELVIEWMEKLNRKGITVVVSTHDVDFAYEWADEIALFRDGRVFIQGRPQFVFGQITSLEMTHLRQPAVMQMFENLCRKGLLQTGLPLPKTISELEQYMEGIQNHAYRRKSGMQGKKNAILVVSFGTTHDDTRIKTIDEIEREIQENFPDYQVFRAWTSRMILGRLREERGIVIPNVTQAMEQMVQDGIENVVIQPTHIVNGLENEKMKEDALFFQNQFYSIRFGSPLLSDESDNREVIKAVMQEFMSLEKKHALVWMGHGTTHYANAAYAALDYTLKDMGYKNVFMGTVEAYPSMETILKMVKEYAPEKVILTPFMIVAGDHAKNDMASEDENSWKCQFEREGFMVDCVLKGLGEYAGIRKILIRHLMEAIHIE